MKTLLSVCSFTILLLSGCCSGKVSLRQVDNPAIRKIQEEETARHISDDHMKAAFVRHLGQRVRIIFSGNILSFSHGFPPAGRGVALTADGYFLTAYHVVGGLPFYIEDAKLIRQPPAHGFESSEIDKYFQRSRHPGRLVWSDPAVDLAIVKFSIEGHPHFTDFEVSPPQGRTVITADDEGYGILFPDANGNFDLKSFVGNRAFFAAGSILRAAEKNAASRSISLSTTVVARGGMSGAPLVTADYELCGIISQVKGLGLFQNPRTVATMINPEYIFKVIDSDRKEQQANKTVVDNRLPALSQNHSCDYNPSHPVGVSSPVAGATP